ncbi:MAG: HEAT repeat domain-containing protein [Myxococcota bacterium]
MRVILLLLLLGCHAYGEEGVLRDQARVESIANGGSVRPWAGGSLSGGSLSGVSLFTVTETHRIWGAAVLDGEQTPRVAGDAFSALRDHPQAADPVMLAGLAMLFIDPDPQSAGMTPWLRVTGDRMPSHQALARPPQVGDGVLEYWRWHGQMADLVRCRVDLQTLQVELTPGSAVLDAQAAPDEGLDRAEAALRDARIPIRRQAVADLIAMDDRAAGHLLGLVALEDDAPAVRKDAVEGLQRVAAPDRAAVLSQVLDSDGAADVRRAAAYALGAIGDPAGRDALERASQGDPDRNTRTTANVALRKLSASSIKGDGR